MNRYVDGLIGLLLDRLMIPSNENSKLKLDADAKLFDVWKTNGEFLP